jgi:hypothetical protein
MSDLKLLLTPSQRQLLKDAAHRLGVREQVIARNAVLAALTGPAPIAAPKPSVIPSLHRIHAQLLSVAAALENITDALGDIDGQDDTETSAAIAASNAAAANGQRVARRVLRGLEQPARRAGESTGGPDATTGGTEEAAGGPQRKTNT